MPRFASEWEEGFTIAAVAILQPVNESKQIEIKSLQMDCKFIFVTGMGLDAMHGEDWDLINSLEITSLFSSIIYPFISPYYTG